MIIKTFNAYEIYHGQVETGITIAEDRTIHVGEEGRGRSLVRVPIPDGSVLDPSGQRLLKAPLRVENQEIEGVIYIRDHSGYRGGWKLTAARPEAEWDLIVRRAAAHRPPNGQGALSEGHKVESWDDKSCPACDAIGTVPERKPHDAYVIAEVFCAQGAAGRMGGEPEYLLFLRAGKAVEIIRSGRLYGAPSELRVEANRDGSIKITDPRAKAMERLAALAWQVPIR